MRGGRSPPFKPLGGAVGFSSRMEGPLPAHDTVSVSERIRAQREQSEMQRGVKMCDLVVLVSDLMISRCEGRGTM